MDDFGMSVVGRVTSQAGSDRGSAHTALAAGRRRATGATAVDLDRLLDVPDRAALMAAIEDTMLGALGTGIDSLGEPALRVTRGGGKRLRAALVAACAHGVDQRVDRDVVARAAASVELVHQGSLVHDDIIDAATTRRGVPTVNHVEGADRALLVGDLMLAKAGQLAASVSQEVAADVAVVIEDLTIGQALELDTVDDPTRSVADALTSIEGKTASLMRTACSVGARCADADPATRGSLARFGHAFGMAFQLVDDVLDIVGDPQRLGKPVGGDLRAGVHTVPHLFAAEELGDALHAQARRARTEPGAVAECIAAVRSTDAIGRAVDLATGYVTEATDALAPAVARHPDLAGVARLPAEYIAWALPETTLDGA